MIFGIDFDGTYADAPLLWSKFIREALKQGHKVYIVTGRNGNTDPVNTNRWMGPSDLLTTVKGNSIDVIYTHGFTYKEDAMETLGIKVDVWIDDDPGCIQPSTVLENQPDTEL